MTTSPGRRRSGHPPPAASPTDLLIDVPVLLGELLADATTLSQLEQALATFSAALADRIPCDRVEVWLHDRNARRLRRVGSTARIGAQHARSRLARALRRTRTESMGAAARRTLLTPIRGRRRAVGVLRVQGVRRAASEMASLAASLDRIGWQTAALIEHVQLLSEVLRARRELESTFAALQDLVVVCDRALVIRDVNDAFARRVSRPRQSLAGQPLGAWMAADTLRWIGGVRPAPGRSVGTELVDARLGGTLSLIVSGREAPDAAPPGLVIVIRDVTAERALEAEQRELRQQLAHSEKLAALGQFVAGIAHELNNPLQGIIGHVELMRAESNLPGQVVRDLRLVEREADRAARIVRDLLVFARSGTLASRRPVQVVTVLKRVLAQRQPACRAAGIRISATLPPGLPRIAGDGLLLQQAFLNVVLNAEQAMSSQGGGRLTVRAWKSQESQVAVEVKDTGPGIPEDVLPRVFEPFFTTKSVGEGTGLGLALTYGIIREHGGNIAAKNAGAGGAVFAIYLPTVASGRATL